MGYGYGIIASGFVNDDGSQKSNVLEKSHSNFVSQRISTGIYLITLPVEVGEGALAVHVTRAGSDTNPGGLAPLVVERASPTTFYVLSERWEDGVPLQTGTSFSVLVICNDGVSFEPAFDIAGMGSVNADGTSLDAEADPTYNSSVVDGGIFLLTTQGYTLAQRFEVSPHFCVLGAEVARPYALTASIVSDSLLACYAYSAPSPGTGVTGTDFSFVAIRGRNRSL